MGTSELDEERHGQLAVDWDLLEQVHELGIDATDAANDGLARAASEARARQREDDREPVTIRLNAKALAYFRESACDDRDYESEINRVLCDYVMYQMRGRRRAPPRSNTE